MPPKMISMSAEDVLETLPVLVSCADAAIALGPAGVRIDEGETVEHERTPGGVILHFKHYKVVCTFTVVQ